MNRRGLALRIHDATIHLGQDRLSTDDGDFEVHFFRDLVSARTAMAVCCGDLRGTEPLLSRVHSSCLTSECLMGRDCDCAEQLRGALAAMSRAGRGVLFYLMQEGRGAGLAAKARDRMLVQASGNRMNTFEAYAEMGLPADLRRYEELAPICRLLGLRSPLWLLTNNPEKASAVASVLADEKIEIRGTRSIQGPVSPFNSDYLGAKHDSGHSLDPPAVEVGAMPPERVRVFPPVSSREDPNLVVMASYFLPLALDDSVGSSDFASRSTPPGRRDPVEWFRASVVYDRETTRESIVLSRDDVVARGEHRLTMSLFDRLPGRKAAGRERLNQTLCEIHRHGRGSVSVHFDDRDHAGY